MKLCTYRKVDRSFFLWCTFWL